jgi:hypothetical protein
MSITPIIFFDMVASILILSLALIAIVFYLVKVTKMLHANSSLKDEAFKKNAELLDTARVKAVKMLDDANNQALDIVNKVTLSTDVASEKFKEDLTRISSAQIKECEKATSDFTDFYSQVLKDFKSKNIEAFQNVSKDIETNTMLEIKDFKESMSKITTLAQKEVKEKINNDYSATKKEIEDYKKEELQKIDSGIYGLLEKTAKEVFGKALSLSQHEDLIEKSLEKAKKEGVFKT